MIHDVGRSLQEAIKAKGSPFTVVDGPEPSTTTTWARERIVIEYVPGGDKVGPATSQHVNPRHVATFSPAARITIYARSPNVGAQRFEHERRAHAVLRQVIAGLRLVFAVRKNSWSFNGGGFVTPPDLEKSEKVGGAVYAFDFSFDTGVPDLTWAGAAQDEMTILENTIQTTTMVSLTHAPDDDDDPNNIPASAETV